MKKSIDTAKVKVHIVEDRTCLGPHGGARYRVEKWVYSRKTGLTLDYDRHVAEHLTLKEARSVKRKVLRDYYG